MVLGVHSTPFWAGTLTGGFTLAGVIVTQGANVWKQRIDARTRQADRRHERALDYEKRAWEAKNDALKSLISGCRYVKRRAEIEENAGDIIGRAVTIRALDLFRERIGGEDGISEVTAYAAEPVRQALDEMLKEVDAQHRKHSEHLRKLESVGTRWDALFRQPETDESSTELPQIQRLEQLASLRSERKQALEAIGRTSGLEVDEVIALCDKVIDAAGKDVKVGYTE
jgi:hypothetical protein